MTDLAVFDIDMEALEQLPPAEREQRLTELAALKPIVDRNPLWKWVPHEGEKQWKEDHGIPLVGGESRGQMEFLEIEQPIGAYVAGNRSGKSEVGCIHELIQLLPVEFLPPWLWPYKKWGLDGEEVWWRMIGVDLPNWLDKAIIPKLRRLVPPAALYKGEFDKAYSDRTHKLRFQDGSWLDFLTHDMDVDSYASAELHGATFDEEPPGEKGKSQYEETLGRLADHDGDVRWTLTPLLGLTFVYEDLTVTDPETGEDVPRRDDEVHVVEGDIDHNPHMSEKGRARFLKRFAHDPLKLQARKSGRWVHFAGLIYDEWDDQAHIVPERDLPRDDQGKPTVPVYESIDPGIAKDHAAAFVAGFLEKLRIGDLPPELLAIALEEGLGEDDDLDVLELFHAHKIWEGTAADMCAHVHEVRAQYGYRPSWSVIDPSARNKHHASGRSSQDEYRKHGVFTLAGQNDREAGFNAVKERLASRPRRLVVQAHLDLWFDERKKYRWKKPRRQSEDAPKAEPIKRDDDVMDATRYMVAQLPGAPRPGKKDEEDTNEPAPVRAFRASLARLSRQKRRARIGGYA